MIIKIGQVWKDKNIPPSGRTVEVISIEEGIVTFKCSWKKTRIIKSLDVTLKTIPMEAVLDIKATIKRIGKIQNAKSLQRIRENQ